MENKNISNIDYKEDKTRLNIFFLYGWHTSKYKELYSMLLGVQCMYSMSYYDILKYKKTFWYDIVVFIIP